MFTVDQLTADFRSDVYDRADVDDTGTPRDTLWSPEDVLRYINQAVAQWASDTLSCRQQRRIAIAQGNPRVFLGVDVIEVNRAGYVPGDDPTARPRRLEQFDLDGGVLNDDYGVVFLSSDDIENREGVPRAWTFDYNPQYLRLYPIPSTDGFLFINVTYYPNDLQYGMPLPYTNRKDHDLVLLWMKHLAYQKQDADVNDMRRAGAYRDQYDAAKDVRLHELDRIRRDNAVVTPRRF